MAAKKAPAVKKAPAEKKPSLDIKDEMLYSDYKVFDWLDSQTPEMAKTFSPLVAMKWQSVVDSTAAKSREAILSVNEIVNIGFWDLAKHPDLQWRLMCAAGSGEPMRHGWVPMATAKKKVTKLNQVFLNLYPHLSDEELLTLKGKFTTDSMKRFLLDLALPDVEIKPLMDEFKKTNG